MTKEYIKKFGTHNRSEEQYKYLLSPPMSSNKTKAVFLDRDGVLNKDAGFISHFSEFYVPTYVPEAIKLINESEYFAIVVTNQPVVARGEASLDELDSIFQKLFLELALHQAYLDAVYFCPHHPDSGFKGENPKFKIPCSCRKPATGMINEATSDFAIDLSQSWMIGDATSDIELGKRVGANTILVRTGLAGTDGKWNVTPDFIEDNVLTAVKRILHN